MTTRAKISGPPTEVQRGPRSRVPQEHDGHTAAWHVCEGLQRQSGQRVEPAQSATADERPRATSTAAFCSQPVDIRGQLCFLLKA